MNALLVTTLLAAAAADTAPPELEHAPIATASRGSELVIVTQIRDPAGVFGASLYWRAAGDAKFNVVELTREAGDRFTAAIPGSKVADALEYYVEAYDELGNGPTRVGAPDEPIIVAVSEAQVAVAPRAIAPGDTVLEEPAAPLPIGPIAVGAAGALLLAGGAGAWFSASSTVADIDAKYPTAGAGRLPSDLAATQDAIGLSRVGSVLMIAGVAAIAGGGAWFVLAPPVAGGGDGFAVAVSGSF